MKITCFFLSIFLISISFEIKNIKNFRQLEDTTEIEENENELYDDSDKESSDIRDTSLIPENLDNTDYTENNITIINIKPKIILLGFGHFTPPVRKEDSHVIFRIYFLRFYGNLSKFLFFTIKINDIEKEEQVNCSTILDNNEDYIQYNCFFSIDKNKPFDNISIYKDFKFMGMEDDSIKPYIIYSSLANETMNGLQNALDSDLDNGVNILNETELYETNGLTFKLIGEIKGSINSNNKGVLFFDEYGDGKLKNATCDNIINIEDLKYDFNCKSDYSINAPLTGVMGITNKENKKILIYMKKENEKLILTYGPEKYVLVGFGHFIKKEKYLIFIAYIVKILGYNYPEILYLTLNIHNYSRLRILNEIKTIECKRITKKYQNSMKYNCSIIINSDENYKLDYIEASFPKAKNITYLGYFEDIKSNSNDIFDNLVVVNNSEIYKNDIIFNIKGNIEDINKRLNDNEKVFFPLKDIEDKFLKNVSCSSTHQNNDDYTIDCIPNQNIKVNLNNAIGYTSDKSVIIILSNENNGLVNITIPEPIDEVNLFKPKKSSGLSVGVIIGIIVACLFVIFIALLIILLNRKAAKPPNERSLSQSYIETGR